MQKKETSRLIVIHNMAWRYAERILAQFSTFVVTLILARKLAPSDFGNVALLTIFIDIADILIVQGFSSALVQKKNADNIDFSSVFYFSLFASFLLYVIFFMAAPLLAYIGDQQLPALFRVLALRIPLGAINSVQHAYIQRNLLFKKYFLRTIIGATISSFVGIYMAYSGCGAWAIVGHNLTKSVCDTILLWLSIGWRPDKVFRIKRLKTLIDFGWKMQCSSLVHVIYKRLTTFFIGIIYSTEDLSFYEMGQKIPGIIETNIDTTINSVLFPVMSERQDDLAQIRQMVRKSIQTSGSLIWPMMAGLAVLSDQLILLLYGQKWLPASIFMVIACLKLTLEPIQTANLQAVKAIGRSDLYLKMEIIKKAFGLIIIILSARISVFAIAAAAAIQTFFASLVNGFVNKQLLGYNFHEQISDYYRNAILSLVMALLVFFLRIILPELGLAGIIIEIFTGIIIYSILVFLFNRPQYDYFKSIIQEMRKIEM